MYTLEEQIYNLGYLDGLNGEDKSEHFSKFHEEYNEGYDQGYSVYYQMVSCAEGRVG